MATVCFTVVDCNKGAVWQKSQRTIPDKWKPSCLRVEVQGVVDGVVVFERCGHIINSCMPLSGGCVDYGSRDGLL